LVLDAERVRWSRADAGETDGTGAAAAEWPGPANATASRAFLVGRRLIVWGGVTVLAEHLCPPPVAGQPQCEPWAETAARAGGWMTVLAK
jgi:hypothetical protein